MQQNTNPIYEMTQFDLDVMNEFIYMNSLLFALEQEEIDAVTASCQKVVKENLITSPAQADKVEINYIKMVAEVVDDIRENFPMSSELIQNITSILNRYFDTIFSTSDRFYLSDSYEKYFQSIYNVNDNSFITDQKSGKISVIILSILLALIAVIGYFVLKSIK